MINLFCFSTASTDIEEREANAIASRVRRVQKLLHGKTANANNAIDEAELQLRKEYTEAVSEMLLDVTKLRKAFGDNLIRRDLRSKGEDGEGTITGLKDYWIQLAYLHLSEQEYRYLDEIETIVLESDRSKGSDIGPVATLLQPAVSISPCTS
jgi:hypothetical protein